MDIAIVTGAETPLGLYLIKRLVRQGFRVHGIGNNFSKVTFADNNFHAHPVDLSDLSTVSDTMARILEEEKSLELLIHAIDVTPGAAFEKLPVGNLEAILKVGLLGPVMLTRLALPNLLQFRGQLINVIPANKAGHPASAVNALVEGGLRDMNRAIFDKARDAGLRVSNLILRQNPEPDGLGVQSGEQTHIDLEDVARAVEHLIDPNFVNVPAELVLFPRCSAASEQMLPEVALPVDPYSEVVLPPQEYCPPVQPKIPTQEKVEVERIIPYTDEEMEEKIAAAIEDFESKPPRPQKKERVRNPQHNQEESESGAKNKRRRGRRRGGRNRSRDRKPEQPEAGKATESPKGDLQPKQASSKPSKQDQDKPKRTQEKRPKSEKKKPDSKAAEESKPKVPVTKAAKKKAAKKKAAKTSTDSAQDKTPKKKAVKKAAKKASKKASKKAAKKTAAKKTAKKSAKKTVKKTPAKKAANKKAK